MSKLLKTIPSDLPLTEESFRDISQELLYELLERGEPFRLRARGSSMGYIIKEGDLITIKGIKQEELKIGDIILFNKVGNLVCHRLISIHNSEGQLYYTTKGDVLLQADHPLPVSNVVGKVFHVLRGKKSINLDRKLARVVGYCSARYSRLIFHLYSKYGFYRSSWDNPETTKFPLWFRRNFERLLRLPIKLLTGMLILASPYLSYLNKR